jgi:hypothetical protein
MAMKPAAPAAQVSEGATGGMQDYGRGIRADLSPQQQANFNASASTPTVAPKAAPHPKLDAWAARQKAAPQVAAKNPNPMTKTFSASDLGEHVILREAIRAYLSR